MPPNGPLTQLAQLLLSAASKLETVYEENNLAIPSLNATSFNHNDEKSDRLLIENADAAKASATIQGICGMLTNMVQAPVDNVRWTVTGFLSAACIRTAIEANLPELLREKGGQNGLHIKEIAGSIGADENRLARILRYLCTIHIFQETAPDVFANNRNSLALDCGVPLAKIRSQEDKATGTGATAVWIIFTTDICMSASGHLADIILDPGNEFAASPFNHWAKTDAPFFAWLNSPENRRHMLNFSFGMGSQNRGHKNTAGFDWKTLPKSATIVDVGGGQGFATEPLTKQHPEFKVVVQDQPAVIEDAKKHWSEVNPVAVSSGALVLQAHDFFDVQPVKGADVYFMRMILHDWDGDSCIKLLKRMREVASPTSKLLVLDGLIDYACPASTLPHYDIEGAEPDVAPEPLPTNYGLGGLYPYRLDLIMMHHFPSQERSVVEFSRIFKAAGWKLVRVYRGEMAQMLGEPIQDK